MYSPLWKIIHQKPIGFAYSPLWEITHQSPLVLCTPPLEKSPSKFIGFVYSPLWKIIHQNPLVLYTFCIISCKTTLQNYTIHGSIEVQMQPSKSNWSVVSWSCQKKTEKSSAFFKSNTSEFYLIKSIYFLLNYIVENRKINQSKKEHEASNPYHKIGPFQKFGIFGPRWRADRLSSVWVETEWRPRRQWSRWWPGRPVRWWFSYGNSATTYDAAPGSRPVGNGPRSRSDCPTAPPDRPADRRVPESG